MRKLLSAVLFAAIILSICAVTAFAAEPVRHRFADTDGDGICDNVSSCAYADGDGVCNAAGNCAYIDADGDGVCDNYASGQVRGGHGSGHHGHGHGNGHGCGR